MKWVITEQGAFMDAPEKSGLLLDQFFSQQEGLRLCHPENQNK